MLNLADPPDPDKVFRLDVDFNAHDMKVNIDFGDATPKKHAENLETLAKWLQGDYKE